MCTMRNSHAERTLLRENLPLLSHRIGITNLNMWATERKGRVIIYEL